MCIFSKSTLCQKSIFLCVVQFFFCPKRSFPVIVQSFSLFIAALHNIDLNASWRTRRVSAWIFDHNSEESLMSCIFSENWSISPTRMNSIWKHSVCMKVTIDRVPFTSNYPYFHQENHAKTEHVFRGLWPVLLWRFWQIWRGKLTISNDSKPNFVLQTLHLLSGLNLFLDIWTRVSSE